MALHYPPDLPDRIARVLSEILTDKYGEEYAVKITLRRVNKESERRDERGQACVRGV